MRSAASQRSLRRRARSMPMRKLLARDSRHLDPRRRVALSLSDDRSLSCHGRSGIRHVDRSCSGQHGRSRRCRRALFRRSWKDRDARQNSPKRNDRFRGTGICVALRTPWSCENGHKQSGVLVGEVPEVRARLPGRLYPGERSGISTKYNSRAWPICRVGRSCSHSPALA